MTKYQGTRITDPPTLRGTHGRAWRVTLPDVGQRGQADFDGTVGAFLVHSPGATVLWDHYLVSLIHLRPIKGGKPARINEPWATHELMIASLNPEQALPSVTWSQDWAISFLRPLDVVAQFSAANDAVADRILELAVEAIVHGIASPDQDWRAWWTHNIVKTAEHFADGTHQMQRPS